MTLEQLQDRLQVSLDHFIGLGNVLKSTYPSLYPSEQGMMIYALLVAGRRLSALVKEVLTWQERFINNVTSIDWVEKRRDLLAIMDYLKQFNCDISISMRREGGELIFESEKIVERENLNYWFPPKENATDYVKTRRLMINSSEGNYSELKNEIDTIDGRIDELLNDARKLSRDEAARMERLKVMRSYYKKELWEQDRASLVNRVKGELRDSENDGKSEKEILQSLLQDIVSEHTLGNNNRDLGYLNQQRDSDNKVALVMSDKRALLAVDDVFDHFKFVESEKLLKDYIESRVLKEECSEYEGRLFVNKASLEFMQMVGNIIEHYIDFQPKQNAAFIFAALREVGFVKNNATLMAVFFSDEYHEDITSDNITKPLRCCDTKDFCILDENNLASFTIAQFKKYKEVYWRCQSIIIKLLGVNRPPCADYLSQLHPNIEEDDLFVLLNDAQQRRLKLISSVLRGESLVL